MDYKETGVLESNKLTEQLYEKFLDSRLIHGKLEVLQKMHRKRLLTDKIISDFAVTLDVVVNGNDLEERYYDLLRCMESMAKFETYGLR